MDTTSTPVAAPPAAPVTLHVFGADRFGGTARSSHATPALALAHAIEQHGRALDLVPTGDAHGWHLVDPETGRSVGEVVAAAVAHRIVRTTGRIGGGSCGACSCGVILRSTSLNALAVDFATHCRGGVVPPRSELEAKMSLDDARSELAAVGADCNLWMGSRGLMTLYVNGPRGEKLGEIWVGSAGCSVSSVWAAVAAVVSSRRAVAA